jgi:putative transposase
MGELSVANEFLKKTAVRTISELKALMDPGNQELSIVKQCSLLGLNRSSFYYAPVRESDEVLVILRWLDEQYLKTPFWGARKLIREIAKEEYKLNMKRLRRLMSIHGWRTLYPQPRTSVSDPAKYKYPYLLKDLKIERRKQVWEIDITNVPMKGLHLPMCDH